MIAAAAAAAAAAAPDFSQYWGTAKHADCWLVLEEEGAVGHKRQLRRVPGHAMVLVAFSGYCKAKLDNWEAAGDAGQEVCLPVAAGQLDLGERMIKCMYQAQPDLSGLGQQQLLQLLLLADRYEVLKVQAAVSAALAAIPAEALHWETVQAVYSLPAGCADLPALKEMYAAAAAKLQQQLGDLEEVWFEADSSLSQQLLALPHAALKQLLQDPATRVASENTVFHTIQQWDERQSTAVPQQQLKELMELIRMQHCSQLYVATVVARSELAQQCFSQDELLMAVVCAGVDTESGVVSGMPDNKLFLDKHPSWRAAQRSASAVQEAVAVVRVPVQAVLTAVEQQLAGGLSSAKLTRAHREFNCCTWRARGVHCALWVERASNAMALQLRVAAFAGTSVQNIACSISGRIGFLKPEGPAGRLHSILPGTHRCVTALTAVHARLVSISSCQEAEEKLRALGLVHPDNCLHVRLEVTHLT